jgi:hypothetical protein
MGGVDRHPVSVGLGLTRQGGHVVQAFQGGMGLDGLQWPVQLRLGQHRPHALAHRKVPKLGYDEDCYQAGYHPSCDEERGLEVGGVREGPYEGDEGQHQHDDGQDAASPSLGYPEVWNVHLVVDEPIGVLVVDPVADATDPAFHLHL